MDNKVFLNGAVATKLWREKVGKFSIFLFVILPILCLYPPAGVLWLISLGHLNFIGVLDKSYDKLCKKIVGEEK